MLVLRNKIIVLLLIFVLSGCAINYIDDKGANHMWGIAHVVTKKLPGKYKDIANIHQVSSFGLYYIDMQQQSSLGIGYVRSYEISVLEDESINFSLDTYKPQNFEFETTKTILEEGNENDQK